MGENSAYYNALHQKRREETEKYKKMLQQHAHGFVDECLIKVERPSKFGGSFNLIIFANNKLSLFLEY